MRNQDSRKDTDKKVAYIADDGCKDTTDKVANDFVVAKTRQNRNIGSPLTDSKIDYKTNQWKVHDFVFHIKCAPFYFTDDSNSHIINNAFDHLAGVYM
mgnify:FL=1